VAWIKNLLMKLKNKKTSSKIPRTSVKRSASPAPKPYSPYSVCHHSRKGK